MKNSRDNFLHFAAQTVWKEHGADVKDLLILFPSHRNVLFFKRALANVAAQPVWAPHLHTMDSLVNKESSAAVPDELSLVMQLYHCRKAMGFDEAFDRFYPLGKQILSDFDLLDRALTDTGQCFELLDALNADHELLPEEAGEEISAMISRLRQTENVFDLSSIWGNLGTLYRNFHAGLRKQGLTTMGMMFRNMATDDQQALSNPYRAVYAVGFYRMSRAEQTILRRFGNVRYIWNMPDESEARELDTELPLKAFAEHVKARSVVYRPEQGIKNVHLYNVSGTHIQFQGLASVIRHIPENEYRETGILIPGQGLLLPLLQVLPESVGKVNVSMGLSVVDTSVFALLRRFIRVQEAWKPNGVIAARRVADFFSHHLIQGGSRPGRMPAFEHNPLYLEPDRHWKAIPEPWNSLLLPCTQKFELADRCLELIRLIYPNTVDEADSAAAYSLFTRIRRFREVLAGQEDAWSPAFFLNFLQRILQDSRINLRGEPLEGMQVLGLFEMANLWFKHLIVAQAGDGLLPVVSFQSLLPYTLRSWYKLPGIEEQVKVQEYLFWQLLGSAEQVHLFYNEHHDGLGGSEPSRWVRRLMLGMHPEHWQVSRHHVNPGRTAEPGHVIEWEATGEFTEKVRNQLAESMSYSGLNTWLSCRLRYALQNIHGFREADEPTEEIEARDIGNIVHKVMETLYGEYTGQIVTAAMEKELRRKAGEILNSVYPQLLNIPAAMKDTGKHLFYMHAMQNLVSRMLDHDFKRRPFEAFSPVSLEQRLEHSFEWDGARVNFKGFIDRVDRTDKSLRIIDYKSGVVYGTQLNNGSTQNIMLPDGRNNQYALQTLFYAWLYQRCEQTADIAEVHVYPARGIEAGKTRVIVDKLTAINQDQIDAFEEQLFNQLSIMLSPGVHISQTPNRSVCTYCPYRVICKR